MYPYVDYFKEYGRIMQFNKNKGEPVHRWYSFVEGYSKEFIQSIVNEIEDKNVVCLEPFSGSGTTSLELQKIGMKCISFEVNPFMYLVGKVKLFTGYKSDELKKWFERKHSEFIAVHGRCRGWKTYLVKEQFKDRFLFWHTGLSPYDRDRKKPSERPASCVLRKSSAGCF